MRAQETAIDQQQLLLDYIERLNQFREGRRAIHLRLSALRPQNRREHHIRIAANAFDGLVRRFDGQLFILRNNDLFIVLKGASIGEIDEVVLKLRFLFSDDPLFIAEEGRPGADDQVFCTWYDVETDYIQLLNDVRYLVRANDRGARPVQPERSEPAPAPDRRPMDPATLARLEGALRTMNLSNIVRRQAVCAIFPGRAPQHMFSELFVSIALLEKSLIPGVDIASDRWLFQRLTETLDQRVLALLPEVEGRLPLPVCVNVNVSTLLSPEFLAFDRAFRQRTQKVVVFELQSIDVFGDMGSFIFAREFVRDRGYRLTLDGLNHLIFPMFDRASLGFDFQKMTWSADIQAEIQSARTEALSESIRKVGPNRVILCRCDSAEAIAFGHSVGITLFQGSHVDRLLHPQPATSTVPAGAQQRRPQPAMART